MNCVKRADVFLPHCVGYVKVTCQRMSVHVSTRNADKLSTLSECASKTVLVVIIGMYVYVTFKYKKSSYYYL